MNSTQVPQQEGQEKLRQPEPFVPLDTRGQHHMQKMAAKASLLRKILATIIAAAGVLFGTGLLLFLVGALVFAPDARDRARLAAANQTVYQTYAQVLLCADTSGTVLAPSDNAPLCSGDGYKDTWPAIEQYGARWGGCEFVYKVLETDQQSLEDVRFQYCAVLPKGGLAICTDEGCVFDVE